MPKRTDIKSILIIGSGPIVIGQACEFDYSGTQACKALKEEGYRVILVNSNPATIMTDPDTADRTYIEPITADAVAAIIAAERPDAILPTLGGQTALNCAMELASRGVLHEFGVEMIGATPSAIEKAESRQLFKAAMERIGLESAASEVAHTMQEARRTRDKLGYPVVIRPAFTMGGAGGGFAYDDEEFERICSNGLALSPTTEVLIEESILGWKEFEMEVMRDKADNAVIICSIENLDPMGIHTGDSITVAPAQTLTDKEYQRMRDASIAILREIGVETGGSNVQFAVNPVDGRMVVIEMNPRVSRSSALASKATGFPIAKIAAKLAVGYTLPEIPNDITRATPSCFEPSIDYVVTKIPRFNFEKFPGASNTLGTQMKSVGEAMSIGRSFKESLQKGFRSLETGRDGFGGDGKDKPMTDAEVEVLLDMKKPQPDRLFGVRAAFERGWSLERVQQLGKYDPWFLAHIQELIRFEIEELKGRKLSALSAATVRKAKEWGFSDQQIAFQTGSTEAEVRLFRKNLGVVAVFKTVDTCAAEFEAHTPYHYSTYEEENESVRTDRKKVVILGGGPNRIGQGIEFDYCCCHASYALKEEGVESIMINSNPETVSTDYDTSDKLYFEPLNREELFNILEHEKPDGVILQFGGQTPLKLAKDLEDSGVRILGTSPKSIWLAEDRKLFNVLMEELGIKQPAGATATNASEARAVVDSIGFPVLARPSFVLGGRAMKILYSNEELAAYMRDTVHPTPEHPILIDQYLENATEVDVDCIRDTHGTAIVAGIMQHIEEAGIHSGDSACVLPTTSLSDSVLAVMREQTVRISHALEVVGLMNIQFAVKDEQVYVLEVNPRASRTVPFVAKATGIPFAKLATKAMLGKSLAELGYVAEKIPAHYSVKESVFPFAKFHGSDTVLGPEMKSTGEVMGIDSTFGAAFAKSQIGASCRLPLKGTVFVSVNDRDKPAVVDVARRLSGLGLKLVATSGTAAYLREQGIDVDAVKKVSEGPGNIVDQLLEKKIALLINTPMGSGAKGDDAVIRQAALRAGVPYTTTLSAASAAAEAIATLRSSDLGVKCLQDWYS
jgi:carbamoyl-phosphate synthase large subunit